MGMGAGGNGNEPLGMGITGIEKDIPAHLYTKPRRQLTDLGNVKVKRVLEVLGLRDDHQIETPAAAEVGDDDGVNRHRRQKLFPRRLRRLSPATVRKQNSNQPANHEATAKVTTQYGGMAETSVNACIYSSVDVST